MFRGRCGGVGTTNALDRDTAAGGAGTVAPRAGGLRARDGRGVGRLGGADGRREPADAALQGGLVLLAIGLAGLVVASPLGSLALLLAAAMLTGAGHGIGFLYAQDDLNRIAPGVRRGEVTAVFITCIYVAVAGSVIAVGLLDTRISLTVAVGIVAAVLAVTALAAGAWHRYGDA